jgi:hypothetical protein
MWARDGVREGARTGMGECSLTSGGMAGGFVASFWAGGALAGVLVLDVWAKGRECGQCLTRALEEGKKREKGAG